jgi:hypothetical protein
MEVKSCSLHILFILYLRWHSRTFYINLQPPIEDNIISKEAKCCSIHTTFILY